jgi:outer membrane receptor protein involved in Fe transport
MNTTSRISLAAYVAAVLGAASVAPPALGADDDRPKDKASYQTIEEVIVTARKREEFALEVPAAVTSLNAESLAVDGMARLEDYATRIPGMSITALTRGYTSVVIRGISTGISQATPSTAYYIDDAPIGSVTAYAVGSTLTPDIDPMELQRVEVLKGPQGTLYGAAAVGGLVRYVTALPDLTRIKGSVTVGGNAVSEGGDGWNARGAVNVPFGNDTMALRLSAFTRTDAGYIDNPISKQEDVNEARTDGGRAAWLWQPNEDWSVHVWGMTQRFSADGIGAENVNAPSLTPVAGELTRGTYIPEKQEITLDAYNATINGRVHNFDLTSSTTYQTVDAETNVDQTLSFGPLFQLFLGIPGLGAQTRQMIHTTRWSEELRMRSAPEGAALEYELGLFYNNEDNSNRLPPMDPFLTATGTPFPLGIPVANAQILSKYEEYSGFANGTWHVTSQFDLQAGLRYSHDSQQYLQDYKLAVLTPKPVYIEQDVSHNKTTYLLSASYMPSKDTNFYGRIATGYRPGGPSALPPGVVPGGRQEFDPDSLTSYELGVKSVMAGGTVSLEAALFYTDWKDIQIQTSTQTAAGTFQYFVNGGTATSKGAEATLLYLPFAGMSLRATGAYTDSKLSEDAPAAGGRDGDRMPFVPQWTASFVADYRFPVSGRWQPFVGGSYGYIGERVSTFSNKNPQHVPSYHVFGLNAGADAGNFRVSLYGKNLNDARGINFMNSIGLALPGVNPLGNPFAAGVIQPRTIGMDVSYRF